MGESTGLIITIVCIALAITLGVTLVLLIRLQKKLQIFMSGKNGANLEETLTLLTERTIANEKTLESHKEGLEYIDARVKKSLRGYSLVRYNAYSDGGGEQSFASGLLDERGDGYILSVITNRNHVGLYAKKVVGGTCQQSLTREETEALTTAIAQTKS
jgi:hypothetical protein